MGNYDLYGNHYRTATEAMNAEMAQCAEIDTRLLYKKMSDMEYQINHQQPYEPDEQVYHLQQHINNLEERLQKLERLLTAQ